MAVEITLGDQRALLAANIAAARAGQSPVAVDRIIDVTIAELRAAGLTAVDDVVGYATERPVVTAGVTIGVFTMFCLAFYFWRKSKSKSKSKRGRK